MSNSNPEHGEDSQVISDEFIIRPNFKIPEPEQSEVLKVLVEGIPRPLERNFNRSYTLKRSDGSRTKVSVSYIFDPAFEIPDQLLPSLKKRKEFFGMLPPSLDSPILALVSCVAFENVKDVVFDRETMMDEFVPTDLTDRDFIVMDVHKFSEMLNAWDLIGLKSEDGQEVSARREEPHDKFIFLERRRGLFTTHYCEEYFRLKLSEEGRLPKDTQHLALRNKSLIYATPGLVAGTAFEANLYKRNSKNPTGHWPPQLRRCGRSVYWSQHSGKELMRWKDSDGYDYHEATPVCDLETTRFTVRRIATSDATENNHLAIVVDSEPRWKILFFDDVNNGKFVDLLYPLRTIDSVAVMNGVVYVLGNATDSLFPNVVIYYKDGRWSSAVERIRDILPTVFFPMNGRLYLFANGLETIEVFDPETGTWSLSRVPPDMNDICGHTLLSTPARLKSEI